MACNEKIYKENIWSVITTVPTGYREFCYLADNKPVISHKHPTNPQRTLNWRRVYGPPPRQRPSSNPHVWSVERLSNSLQANLRYWFDPQTKGLANKRGRGRRRKNEDLVLEDLETNSTGIQRDKPPWKCLSMFTLCAFVAVVVVAYLVVMITRWMKRE